MGCVPDNTPKSVILSTQTQCPECRYEVQSMLRRVQGVYSVSVNADRNTITVSGNLAPKELLDTLLKVSQDADFCIKPQPHISPSSCQAYRSACRSCSQARPCFSNRCTRQLNNCNFKVCSSASTPPCCAVPQRCCACVAASRAAACCYPHYPGHGRC